MVEEKKVLGFEISPTESVIYSGFIPNLGWGPLAIKSSTDKSFWPSPFSAGLNYGLAVFEGMKAFRHKPKEGQKIGEIFLFRPKDHAERFARSLKGLLMPAFPVPQFLEALQLLVKANAKFVPEYRQGSLYIRPIAYGLERLGFAYHPDVAYTAAFWCTPVGNYYSEGLKPISVYVARNITRAMPGGVGCCKASGNYEISRVAQMMAKKEGCNDALFLEGRKKLHIEELGAANVFVVKNKVLYTPLLKDTVLPGITRKSILTIAESILHLKVKEQNIAVGSVKELADEVFACGTAAVITPIGRIKDGETFYTIGDGQPGEITKKLYDLLTGIQYGDLPDQFGWLEKVIL